MKQNLIPLREACERYDKTDDGFYSSAFLYKKEMDVYPEWYIINNNGIYIDTYEYERYSILERKSWLVATNDLYYLLTYDYGCTDTQISRFMSRHSKKFTNEASWSAFLTKSLFSLPRTSILKKRFSMTMDFLLSGTYMLKILMSEERDNAIQQSRAI